MDLKIRKLNQHQNVSAESLKVYHTEVTQHWSVAGCFYPTSEILECRN